MREEFADLRRSSLSGLTAAELKVLKAGVSCGCDVRATHLWNHRYFCSLCARVEESKRRKRQMDELSRL
jgi:hypothetical protein